MEALQKYFRNMKGQGEKAEKVLPFSSAYKYSGVLIGGGQYLLGAPEVVLGEKFAEYQEKIEEQKDIGYLYLALTKEKRMGRRLQRKQSHLPL